MTSVAARSISLSWSVPSGSVVTSYEVEWQRDTSGDCSDQDEDSATVTDTSYDILGLNGGSGYTVTVTASNNAGSSKRTTATRTLPASKIKSVSPLEHFK